MQFSANSLVIDIRYFQTYVLHSSMSDSVLLQFRVRWLASLTGSDMCRCMTVLDIPCLGVLRQCPQGCRIKMLNSESPRPKGPLDSICAHAGDGQPYIAQGRSMQQDHHVRRSVHVRLS